MSRSCRFCGNEIVEENFDGEREYSSCPTCGQYIYPLSSCRLVDKRYTDSKQYDLKKLTKFLFYNKQEDRRAFVGTDAAFNAYLNNSTSKSFLVTPEIVENWYPQAFSDKVDHSLLWIAKHSKYLGDKVKINLRDAEGLFFMYNDFTSEAWENEFRFIISYYIENGMIAGIKLNNIDDLIVNFRRQQFMTLSLTEKAWAKVYELQKQMKNNKNVFVAMTFHESANDIRTAIKKGIEDANYSSLLMDEIVHNHQIVPEMLRLIKEARFMIMDITQPNFGAYYEAGYAQGLGKEVIITCSQEVWDKKDFSCDKDQNCYYKQIATKPHFDIAQKQVLRWKDYDDLAKQLSEWIKHIIG